MARLNEYAKIELREAGVTQTQWAHANYSSDGRWHGDACGCPDDRCIGYHHDGPGDCGCLRTLLASYRAGEGFFAEPAR